MSNWRSPDVRAPRSGLTARTPLAPTPICLAPPPLERHTAPKYAVQRCATAGQRRTRATSVICRVRPSHPSTSACLSRRISGAGRSPTPGRTVVVGRTASCRHAIVAKLERVGGNRLKELSVEDRQTYRSIEFIFCCFCRSFCQRSNWFAGVTQDSSSVTQSWLAD